MAANRKPKVAPGVLLALSKTTLADLVWDLAATQEKFGEAQNEPLVSFLGCEAFESRMDPQRARAFQIARALVRLAMVSR